MAPTSMTTRALDLPEIKARIASFLNNKDRISCMLVSRDWCSAFAGLVWNTLDFDKDESFSKIPQDVISKYGHLIRNVVQVSKEEHIMALQHPSIACLNKIEFFITHNNLSILLFHDLVGYHRQSLTALRVSGELVADDFLEEQVTSGVYLTLDSLRPTCSLVSLILVEVCISRRAFSSILRSCPSLQSVELLDVIFLGYSPMLEHFRHTGLRTLSAARDQVWSNGEQLLPGTQSLLIHFPALETWKIKDSRVESLAVLEKLKVAILINCPKLKRVRFSMTEADRIATYLDNGFHGLEYCSFNYTALNQPVLLGLLEYQATLTSIVLISKAVKIDLSTPDELTSSKKMIGLLLKTCERLQVLSAEGHRMDVCYLEDENIACMGLQELRVRFLGLDTPALVDGCLETLSTRRKSGAGTVDGPSKSGKLVSDRVCCQLMRFKKLRMVWLGTREYYLATY
ncbi:hypothetical protein BGZ97_013225 [Linnemannia gamsii]|uniref:F-box domain-containing protein n=1 Tax=Linnemannia gamsii TaxID=64522 RepID=A0A9P6R3G4_9FUNG|nr:hypothetical protein BGZ97_013225 [Linnemannia gamsii]